MIQEKSQQQPEGGATSSSLVDVPLQNWNFRQPCVHRQRQIDPEGQIQIYACDIFFASINVNQDMD